MNTLCIGEILWDIFPDKKIWGGAPANFIFHTSQLGANAAAYSALGKDKLGQEIYSAIKACGINLRAPEVDYPTGIVDITLNVDGSANYQFNSDCAWDHIPLSSELINLSKNADLIAFGSLAQRSEESRKTIYEALRHRKPTCKVLFDVNLRQNFYCAEILDRSLKECNFLKLNEEELPVICELLAISQGDILSQYNIELLILTLGSEGSHIISQTEESIMPASPCELIDTVGAGDSFTAAFIINYLKGKSIRESQKIASDLAAYVCSHSGATVEIPDLYRLTHV